MFTVSIEGSLSASALECLLKCTDPNLQSKEIALPFDSLLIGWPDEKAPIQIIHQSLREILTCAKSKFSINEKEHSQRPALCCLSIIGRDMHPDIPCAGFIHGNEEGVPKMPEDANSEEL